MSGLGVAGHDAFSLERVLKSESLPTLPSVAMQLLQMTSDPKVSIADIAQLIKSDPGLAGKVLKTVNSSFYGLPRPCPSIDRAIAMLGLRAVKSLVLGFSMLNLTRDLGDAIDLTGYWKHTVYAAAGARQIAKRVGLSEPDEVFAAALFQDMGVLAMLAVEPKTYGVVFAQAEGRHSGLRELEQTQLSLDHADIGAQLADRWGLPSVIVNSVRYHHAPDSAEQDKDVVQVVALGELAASAILSEAGEGHVERLIEAASEWFEIDSVRMVDVLEDVRMAARDIARLLDRALGEVPTVQDILSRAGQLLVEHQMLAERETMEAQKRADEAERLATTDALTGVGNRKCFDDRVGRVVLQAQDAGTPVAVLFSDADKFKLVNDTYGHHVGDAVLIELARRLAEALGERGTVCRYGGEEFAIILPGADQATAIEVGESLRRAIADRPFDLSQVEDAPAELERTVSVGVACWKPGEAKVAALELVQRSDKAVYLAKESGRNNVKTWGVDLGQETEDTSSNSPMVMQKQAASLSVLVVEDDPLASRLMEVMLRRTGQADVVVAADGRTAVERLRDCLRPGGRLPDVIVCDLHIPGYSGLQILRALKANDKFRHIPIYVVTAAEDDQQWDACRAAGAEDIYCKREICADMKNWCEKLVQSCKLAA